MVAQRKGINDDEPRTCKKCGETKPCREFGYNMTGHFQYVCKVCRRKEVNEKYARMRDTNDRGFWKMRLRASQQEDERRGREFNLTVDDVFELIVAQEGKCAYTGKTPVLPETLSLERIDNTKGHVKGNIILVDTKINKLRSNLQQEEFFHMCNVIARLHPR